MTSPAEAHKEVIVQPDGSLSQDRLEKFLQDMQWELNDWRYTADKEADYYDNNQLDSETLEIMRDRGIPPLVRNLIGPTIDAVAGMEAMNRRDLRVVPDRNSDEMLAMALNEKFKGAQRVSRLDRACSDAYKPEVGLGIGWVEVGREIDPFRPSYRVRAVHRREMFWDWRAREPDLADARFLVRRRWYDEDVLLQVFPKHQEIIKAASNQWAGWDWNSVTGTTAQIDLAREAYEQYSRTSLESMEWLDSERRRLCLYEVWYRIWTRGFVMRLPDNQVLEFDERNVQHRAAVSNGVPLEETPLTKVRQAWWLGPHRMMDVPSPYSHNRLPYVPFWGMREDRTGIPYGLIRRMMSPQDEVNARLSKMMWLLSAKRVMGDEDAFSQSREEVLDEVGRADAFIELDPKRINKGEKPEISTDHQLAAQQYEALRDATTSIYDTGGVQQAMTGKQERNIDSGVAIDRLIEQGAATLAEINDNYSYARQQVGELLLSLVKEDIGKSQEEVEIVKNGKRQLVVMNQMQVDEFGYQYRENDIARTQTHVELEEVPSTPTYRRQQLQQLSEIIKTMPTDIQAPIFDIWIKSTDLANKEELIERLAEVTGYGGTDEAAEKAKQRKKEMQMQAEMEALKEQVAKTNKVNAETDRLRAQVNEIAAKIATMQHKVAVDEDHRHIDQESHDLSVSERVAASAQGDKDEKAGKGDSRPTQ